VTLLAVHLSDGAIATPWLIGGFFLAAILLAIACFRMKEEWIPRVGVLSAAFFIASSIHIKLAILPTSVHLILNGLVGVILGRRAALAMIVGLTLQYFLLAHGGLTTLGMNACIVAVPALIAGQLYSLLRALPVFWRGVLLGSGAAAGSVLLNFLVLLLGGKDDWETLANLVLLAHLPVIIVEGLLLGIVVQYVEKVKPEMFRGGQSAGNTSSNGTSH